VSLMHRVMSEEELEDRGFCRERDRHVYEHGWNFGITGQLDFFDQPKRRVVEVKVRRRPVGLGLETDRPVDTPSDDFPHQTLGVSFPSRLCGHSRTEKSHHIPAPEVVACII
jgi:hypothetical protein